MLKISNLTRGLKRILVIFVFMLLTVAVTSCKGKAVDSIKFDDEYLSVNGYSVSNGDVWKEIKWDAASLFDNKAKEAVLNKELENIKTVMNDKNNENYKYYSERLKNYLIEDVYDLEFSLENHDKEISKLSEKEKDKKISMFADSVYQEKFSTLTTDQIKEALKADKTDDLVPLFKNYYSNLAAEEFARTKLQEEIDKKDKEMAEDKDEDTIGYFSKSDIINKYKSNYLNQGNIDAVVIKFASENEAKQTLKAFGIFVDNGVFYQLLKTPKNYSEYSDYYDKFSTSKYVNGEDYVSLSSYSDAAVLRLYIAMYNYIYTYKDNVLENKDVHQDKVIDQRKTTESIVSLYADIKEGSEEENKLIKQIYEELNANENSKEIINYTSKEIKDIDSSLYTYLYDTLKSPDYFGDREVTEEDIDTQYKAYSTSVQTIGDSYYMAFKIRQEVKDVDKLYKTNISTDDLYDVLTKSENEALYKDIIKDLTNDKLTKEYIDGKVNEALKDVKVKIYDKDIEIAYAKDHADYSKTLSGAPDNNTIAEFKYNDVTVKYYLTTEDNQGLWDVLEHKSGTVTAVNLISKEKIKNSKEYSEIAKDDIDAFYGAIEYILASFANDGLAQQGYPASLGKYNFLMLYYHTADIDEIVDNVFKVNTVISKVLTNYASDEVINFFDEFTQKAYNNFFSVGATQLKVFVDFNEDGKEDKIADWKNKEVEFEGKQTTYEKVAKQLINDIYNLVKNSNSDHQTALTKIVTDYNSSSRHNPGQIDGVYDPIPNEWKYAKYKSLGFSLKTVDITVTNSSTDIDSKIKNKLSNVYKDNNFAFNDFFPSQYLEDASKENSIVEAEDGFNYFLVTSATKPASAKFESFNDTDKVYQDLYYRYNLETIKIESIYNDKDAITKNQIKAFLFEYLNTQTTNLLPSDITTAVTNFLQPVLTRFQSNATQSAIVLNYICESKVNELNFADADNLNRFLELKAISERTADNYATYDSEEDNKKYNNFYGWSEAIDKIGANGGNN